MTRNVGRRVWMVAVWGVWRGEGGAGQEVAAGSISTCNAWITACTQASVVMMLPGCALAGRPAVP
jgi:hypothetical protein